MGDCGNNKCLTIGMKNNMRSPREFAVTILKFFIAISVLYTTPSIASELFSGKTIKWVVPFGPGGGTDTWARFNAPLLKKHLPGNPNVIVVNEPGGGSTKGANLFAARAKPDGLSILGTSSSTQFPYLLGDPRVRYDYRDWHVVMASSTGGVVYVSSDLGVSGPQDIKKLVGQKLVYPGQNPTSLDLLPIIAFDMLGLDVKHVFGFKGRGGGRLAFERGEANIDFQATAAYRKNVLPLVESGKAVSLFTWGGLDKDGNYGKDPGNPELPTFAEIYETIHGTKPNGPQFEAFLTFFTAGFPAAKMVFLPNGTPPEIVEVYKAAFAAMFKDPEYLENAPKVLGNYPQVTGDAAKAMLEVAIGVPDSVKGRVIQGLQTRFGGNVN